MSKFSKRWALIALICYIKIIAILDFKIKVKKIVIVYKEFDKNDAIRSVRKLI